VAFLWTCPFCDRNATIGVSDLEVVQHDLKIRSAKNWRTLRATYIVCPNPKCREFSLDFALFDTTRQESEPTNSWTLVPPSKAKSFPSYIPKQILQDYGEACLIIDASAKASATLSRRCLQGMIRDFWNINKPNLKQEIDELKGRIDAETWEAIDAIRTIGNIGAHMEKDVNVIVDVEPGEAEKLIWLIELLLKQWYVAKHEREENLKEIALIGAEKTKARDQKSEE
jgi:hypothetical protein